MLHIYYYKSICVAFVMNRQIRVEKEDFRNKMANVTNLPKDVLLGVPIVTMTGQIELCVENYRGIIEYADTLVRIKTKTGQIKIKGKGLQIEYYTKDEMKVFGHIISVEYS